MLCSRMASLFRFLVFAFLCAEVVWAEPVLTEFLASNDSILADEDGDFSDWIEIHNLDGVAYDLGAYALTDNTADPSQWTFPAGEMLAPGAFRVVFASNKDRKVGELHTNFRLGSDGGHVSLTKSGIFVSGYDYPVQSDEQSFGVSSGGQVVFFTTPTPGLANGAGTLAGPMFDSVPSEPVEPFAGPLALSLRPRALNGTVASVVVYYRKNFESEVTLSPSGSGGVYSAVIPASAFGLGQMTRWRFEVTDSNGFVTTSPPFLDPENSPKYFGTVGADPSVESNLTILQWFIENPEAAAMRFNDGERGEPGAVFYRGQFYDNVGFKLHGQTSSQFPKKSYNLDFNKGHRFEWSPDAPRVSDIDLLTNWADKSKVRHVLAYEVMRESGVAAHFAYTVRVHQNGEFFSTGDFIEDADETYLERAGLNPEGVLYKAYDMRLNKDLGDVAGFGMQKKTRKDEDNSDLQSLIDALDLEGADLEDYLFDNIDLPSTINYLAALPVIRNVDLQRKNWYLYRDTGKSNEWAMLPWDLDLSQGREFNQVDKYFDNSLLTEGKIFVGGAVRLITRIRANPQMKEMLMRRMRTLHDRFLQEDSTPLSERYFERRLDELSALFDDPLHAKSDAQLDFEKWGSWLDSGGDQVPYTLNHPDVETMAEAITRYKTEYLPGRRDEIYEHQVVGKGGEIPLPQKEINPGDAATFVMAGSASRFLIPSDDSAGQAWIGGSEPFDDSGWDSGLAAIGYDLGSGYDGVISSDVQGVMWTKNASLYLRVPFEVVDKDALQGLELRMQYDDGFIVYLNGVVIQEVNAPASPTFDSTSNGTHEADSSIYDSYDVSALMGALQNGPNILAIHGFNQSKANDDFIINPELIGNLPQSSDLVNPQLVIEEVESAPASGNQDEEFIKITNPHSKAIDISDWTLSSAVTHQFKPGTVIPSNSSLYVSPDVTVFRNRATSPTGGEGAFVQEGYSGHLSNQGEIVILTDDEGVLNQAFSYEGDASDAQLYLTISELMYHPEPDGNAEFIELVNTSESVTLDLTGIRFTSGVEFDFTGSAITSLPPGARVLVVRDLASFEAAYGIGLPVAGVFQNESKLSNSEDIVKLEDSLNNTILEFLYRDDQSWPALADDGYALVYVTGDLNDPESWRISAARGGTPGGNDSIGLPASGDLLSYALGEGGEFSMSGEILSFPRVIGADQVELRIERSTDLASWQRATDLEVLSETPIGGGRMIVTIGGPTLTSDLKYFYRLFISTR